MLSVQNDFDFIIMALIDKNLLPFNLQDGVLISELLADAVLDIESFFSGIERAELVHLGLSRIKYNIYYNIIDQSFFPSLYLFFILSIYISHVWGYIILKSKR